VILSIKLKKKKQSSDVAISQDQYQYDLNGYNDEIKNISSFDILNGDNKITFKKIELNQLKENSYRDISSDRIKSGLSNVATAGGQMVAISSLNPNGLFSATVNPQLLTLFSKDGTVSTMIHGSHGIAGHAGFKSISATVFAPIVVMQLMSMITGQYYMNGIVKQMNSIDNKINKLILLHHTEKVSRLKYAQETVKNLSAVKFPSLEHLTQLKNIEYEIGSIFTEYSKYLEDIDGFSVADTDSHWTPKGEMQQLFSNISKANFTSNMDMTITANELLHLIKIIELFLNIKIHEQQGNRNNQINEIYENISEWNEDSFYAYKYGKKILENYYTPVIEKAIKIIQPFHSFSLWEYEKRCERDTKLKQSFESYTEIKKLMDQRKSSERSLLNNLFSLDVKKELVKQMNTPIEVIYSGSNNGGKLLLKQ
jgi:hypothetical protein